MTDPDDKTLVRWLGWFAIGLLLGLAGYAAWLYFIARNFDERMFRQP